MSLTNAPTPRTVFQPAGMSWNFEIVHGTLKFHKKAVVAIYPSALGQCAMFVDKMKSHNGPRQTVRVLTGCSRTDQVQPSCIARHLPGTLTFC